MILAKYRGRVVILEDVEYEPHISFVPDKHKYWVKPLEEALAKENMKSYKFYLADGFEVVLAELADIFVQIATLKKLSQKCQEL